MALEHAALHGVDPLLGVFTVGKVDVNKARLA
jgi:hypothetical protein